MSTEIAFRHPRCVLERLPRPFSVSAKGKGAAGIIEACLGRQAPRSAQLGQTSDANLTAGQRQ